ncbi:sugar transferase [Rhizobiaceae bacterium n13]|uniref:Sugar transferase n=1 Tax=Ferirhizobium litorale TaxID=2927786 RepID=A0AAE3U034_9HYPH|nr:sugar transferase [Fererhizobium litorale]MDI7860743.1 sugar transferase [Fererhizobium litorale]MDI7920891.1 sugar transferase [Fererhizobium litorale]
MSANPRSPLQTLVVRTAPRRRSLDANVVTYEPLKRVIDLLGIALLAPLALTIIAILALLIRRDGGSAFYCQPRLGKDGKIFNLWKLRTMVPDADRKLQDYLDTNPAARIEWDTTQKLKDDPRITSIGKYLRKYSLDELPQLLNVGLGQMSLVGPRPMMPNQRAYYPGTAYFDMRPGLTGLWQISERNESTFAERALYDNRYAAIMSLGTDLWVLSKTLTVVLRGTGL